jgi:L-seryl-tRNA(Ser) seleniumtransferase
MTASGAVLRETGTTNRTHPKDYRSAIGPNTALILKVHTSNYRITGFTKEIGLEELVLIGREHGVPTMMDLGSGCLVDLSPFGFSGEVPVGAIIKAGVDVVTFSGDKLLGGPQAGIIVGRADLIEKMRRNPLARALRMDKLTLAGLSAVLEDYASHEGPFRKIPTLNMIAKSAAELEQSAHTLADALQRALSDSAVIGIEQGVGRVGGGSLPMEDLPGPRVSLRPARVSAASLERRLRLGAVPVIVLVKNEAVLMDPRTLMPEDLEALPALIAHAMGG